MKLRLQTQKKQEQSYIKCLKINKNKFIVYELWL